MVSHDACSGHIPVPLGCTCGGFVVEKKSSIVVRVVSGGMSDELVERFKKLWAEQNKGAAEWRPIIVRSSVLQNFRRFYSSTRTRGQRGRVYSSYNAVRLTWRAFTGGDERLTEH